MTGVEQLRQTVQEVVGQERTLDRGKGVSRVVVGRNLEPIGPSVPGVASWILASYNKVSRNTVFLD